MTGLHTGHAPVRANAGTIPIRDETMVDQMLKKAGYATGGFGKWGLGDAGSTGVPSRTGSTNASATCTRCTRATTPTISGITTASSR